MKIRQYVVIMIAGILLTSSALLSQQKSQIEPLDISSILRSLTTNPGGQFSLLGLNPDNLQMQHSYEMSYYSFGAQSITQAVYLNTIKYKISDPLSFTFQWGVHHQPFGNSFMKDKIASQGAFISGAQLKYKPNDKLTFLFQYNSYPQGVINPYYSPYHYNRLGMNRYFQPFAGDEDEQ
ncbi:hypothetical protein JXJ21_15145 [candidate division KSB1 bacterium]|nr:hypothetical protein [candidate division KSB1 bacterium]